MKSYAVLAFACLAAVGCTKREGVSPVGAAEVAATPGSYPLTGEILAVETARKILVVKHDEITGYMPAMTMEFVVSAADLAAAKPGQRIRGEMLPAKDGGDFHLQKIWPNDKAAVDTVETGARVLRQDTHSRGKGVYREIGEVLPEFALFDQEGSVVQSARFRGKQAMLNFIFTRCPVQTMCPAATLKMMAVQKLAAESEVKNLELVSITLEPAYDTPAVLKEYAKVRGIETGNFSFLTGPDKAIKDLLVQLGVSAYIEDDLLKHTLTTLLIDETGKIIHRADGSVWEPKDFVAKMRKR